LSLFYFYSVCQTRIASPDKTAIPAIAASSGLALPRKPRNPKKSTEGSVELLVYRISLNTKVHIEKN